MANNSRSSRNSTQRRVYSPHLSKRSFMIITVALLWLQSVMSMTFYTADDICGIAEYEKPQKCSFGNYTVYPKSPFCSAREICFLGLGEPCNPFIDETRCARGLACMCGRCMNCKGTVCNMELCQKRIEVPKRWKSPFEKILLSSYNPGDNEYNLFKPIVSSYIFGK